MTTTSSSAHRRARAAAVIVVVGSSKSSATAATAASAFSFHHPASTPAIGATRPQTRITISSAARERLRVGERCCRRVLKKINGRGGVGGSPSSLYDDASSTNRAEGRSAARFGPLSLDAARDGDENFDYSSYGAMMTDESSSSSYCSSSPLLGDASSSSSSSSYSSSMSSMSPMSMADAALSVYFDEYAGNDGMFDSAPASAVAATVGEGNVDAIPIDGPTSAPTPAATTKAAAANADAKSRFEEDLELTRRVILRHIEKMAIDENEDVDDYDGDDDIDYDDGNADADFRKSRTSSHFNDATAVASAAYDNDDHPRELGKSRGGSTSTMREGEKGDDFIVVIGEENDVDDCEIAERELSSSSLSSNSTDVVNVNAVVAPTISRILRYTLPAIGIWLCSPVLSMIDTAAVGLLAGTAQQAALNPAVSVSDYGALVVAFMYTATTNLVAAAAREDRDDYVAVAVARPMTMNESYADVRRPRPKTTRTLVTALRLASGVGTFFAIALFLLGPRLLKLLIGNDASHLDPIVFSSALRYVRIRALGMPAMVTIGTAQSACLGMQDVRSPLYVLLAAAIVNFLGDVALVPLKGGWWGDVFGGAAGAAWATVASQYAALLFFGRWWLSAHKPKDADAAAPAKWDISLLPFRKKTGGEDDARTTTIASSRGGGHLESDGLLPAAMTVVTTTNSELANTDVNKNRIVRWMPYERRKREHQHPLAPSPPETTAQKRRSRNSNTTTRGFLSDSNLTLRSFLSPKNLDLSKAREFLPFVVPVTTTSVGRISGYIAMSHVASSTLGTIDMAGHQIILSIFCCITPFVDALSQVAQSFVPEVFAANGEGRRKNGRRERAIALRRTVHNFRKVGVGLGAVLVGLVSCIPLISRYFTTDASVLASVHGAIPPVGLFMLVNGLMCAGEGVQVVGIETMWTAFAMYNVIRSSSFHIRLAQLQRRTERGAEVALDDIEPRD
ncbi:hypothetical protein ACHAXA_004050 [Cyclostephanos tholiformis]|uniref:Multidrug and toxic compound extrusion protein n=1 Tax=Cyclostephanos tholiformis TaxID=382380 RepID=A0ABD3R9A5_9STRA